MTSPTDASLIALRNVSMRFDGHAVLRDISLEVPRGQTLGIIGESGCGKTVLLKLIIALMRPSSGKALFDNQVLADLGERELTRQRLRFGFLFQGAALFDSLSVYDNVAFGLRTQGKLPEAEIKERVRQRLQEVGLPANAADKKPAELSGGMKKRVGLARALALDPEVMLYDEPTTGLDPITSITVDEEIIKLRDLEDVSSILVTHQLRDAFYVAEHTAVRRGDEIEFEKASPQKCDEAEFIMLRDGRVAFEGNAGELRAATKDPYIAAFLS
jgi:phospholipid/cholesterol/gamma-HCH transport system ATP-binding protein